MSLPAWWSDKAARRKINARSRAQERIHAKAADGRPQAGSGSSWRAPGDVISEEYLDEVKFTDKSSFSLQLLEWVAIRAKALRLGREPRMVIEFTGGHQGSTKLVVVEVPSGEQPDN